MVCAKNYKWNYQYLGYGDTHSISDEFIVNNKIHLPAGTEIRLLIGSMDNIYIFDIPELHLIEMAVPSTLHTISFKTPSPHTYTIKEGQMCGFKHESMLSDLVVEYSWIFNLHQH